MGTVVCCVFIQEQYPTSERQRATAAFLIGGNQGKVKPQKDAFGMKTSSKLNNASIWVAQRGHEPRQKISCSLCNVSD